MRRSLAIGILLVAVTAAAPLRSAHAGGVREPRLALPGHAVRPGEWIEIRWDDADDVRELEILLSRDGGRTYAVCLSPPLDPRRHAFRWRVPSEDRGALRLRIRYNRDGHEIEGAPSAPLVVAAGTEDHPEPLALPPIDAPRGGGSPARGGIPAAPAGPEGSPAEDESQEVAMSSASAVPGIAKAAPPSADRLSGAERNVFQAPRVRPLRV